MNRRAVAAILSVEMAAADRVRPSAQMLRFAVGFVVAAVGSAVLSLATSQGYLHAVVITNAGYTGSTQSLDAAGQLVMLVAWLAVGTAAGFLGRTGGAFVGMLVGSLGGSTVGFLADPAGNILWLDLIVTVVGTALFLT